MMYHNQTIDLGNDYLNSVHSLPANTTAFVLSHPGDFNGDSKCGKSSKEAGHWVEIPLSPVERGGSAPVNSSHFWSDWSGLAHKKAFRFGSPRENTWVGFRSTLATQLSINASTESMHQPKPEPEENSNTHFDHSKAIEGPAAAEEPVNSILSSPRSNNPCEDLAMGPRQPPNPSDPAPPRRQRFPNILQDPFSRYMNDRFTSFRPSASQHNADMSLNVQHPYQNYPESEPWTKKIRTWFTAASGSEPQAPIWPQPITFNVANSNHSSSSFLPRMQTEPITMEENATEPVYTPQALPVGTEKQRQSLGTSEAVNYWCL